MNQSLNNLERIASNARKAAISFGNNNNSNAAHNARTTLAKANANVIAARNALTKASVVSEEEEEEEEENNGGVESLEKNEGEPAAAPVFTNKNQNKNNFERKISEFTTYLNYFTKLLTKSINDKDNLLESYKENNNIFSHIDIFNEIINKINKKIKLLNQIVGPNIVTTRINGKTYFNYKKGNNNNGFNNNNGVHKLSINNILIELRTYRNLIQNQENTRTLSKRNYSLTENKNLTSRSLANIDKKLAELKDKFKELIETYKSLLNRIKENIKQGIIKDYNARQAKIIDLKQQYDNTTDIKEKHRLFTLINKELEEFTTRKGFFNIRTQNSIKSNNQNIALLSNQLKTLSQEQNELKTSFHGQKNEAIAEFRKKIKSIEDELNKCLNTCLAAVQQGITNKLDSNENIAYFIKEGVNGTKNIMPTAQNLFNKALKHRLGPNGNVVPNSGSNSVPNSRSTSGSNSEPNSGSTSGSIGVNTVNPSSTLTIPNVVSSKFKPGNIIKVKITRSQGNKGSGTVIGKISNVDPLTITNLSSDSFSYTSPFIKESISKNIPIKNIQVLSNKNNESILYKRFITKEASKLSEANRKSRNNLDKSIFEARLARERSNAIVAGLKQSNPSAPGATNSILKNSMIQNMLQNGKTINNIISSIKQSSLPNVNTNNQNSKVKLLRLLIQNDMTQSNKNKINKAIKELNPIVSPVSSGIFLTELPNNQAAINRAAVTAVGASEKAANDPTNIQAANAAVSAAEKLSSIVKEVSQTSPGAVPPNIVQITALGVNKAKNAQNAVARAAINPNNQNAVARAARATSSSAINLALVQQSIQTSPEAQASASAAEAAAEAEAAADQAKAATIQVLNNPTPSAVANASAAASEAAEAGNRAHEAAAAASKAAANAASALKYNQYSKQINTASKKKDKDRAKITLKSIENNKGLKNNNRSKLITKATTNLRNLLNN